MRAVRIIFDNGESFMTDINGTDQEIKDYYLNKYFDFSDPENVKETLAKAISVEFLD